MKKKAAILLIFLLAIAGLLGFAVYKNKEFNDKEHTLEFDIKLISRDGLEDGNLSVQILPRGYDTPELSAWYHTMAGDDSNKGPHYVGTIYEFTIKNLTEDEISDWSLTLYYPEALLFSEGWNGDFTLHQDVDGDEKVHTFESGRFVKTDIGLDYLEKESTLLMPMKEGDYFEYKPSVTSAEVPLAPSDLKKDEYTYKIIGFITYSKNVGIEHVIPFKKGCVTYKIKRSLYKEPLLIIVIVLVWIWIMTLIIMIFVSIKTKKMEKEKAVMDNLIHQFELDDLTQVYSRQAFFHYAGGMLESGNGDYGVAIVDIDNYKLTQNQFGEDLCNEYIIYLAKYLQGKFPDGHVGRFSRSKFAVIYEVDKYQKLNPQVFIDENMMAKSPMPKQVLKVGLYEPVDKSLTIRRCCDRVLLALVKIQDIYGQNVSYFEEAFETQLLDEHKIKETMEDALTQKQFEVYYQPKNYTLTGTIAGAEALVRWMHPDYGFMSPGQFIPVFENTGFITKLDAYVFERVCNDIKNWTERGEEPIPVSVNISRKEFYEDNWLEDRIAYMEKLGINPKYIHLEVTESLYAEDAGIINDKIKWARDKGLLIEMDDFGSGYSSLGMLGTLSLDILKLDISFVRKIKETEIIVQSIIDLAHKLNLKTVAEGIETDEQYEIIKKLGCDYIQGYYFSKPLPREEFEKYIKEH